MTDAPPGMVEPRLPERSRSTASIPTRAEHVPRVVVSDMHGLTWLGGTDLQRPLKDRRMRLFNTHEL